jgi:rhomboid protease GluP
MSADLVAHSFELRERLLAALLADPSAVLVHHDPLLAVVRAGDEDIALLTHDGLDTLAARAAQLKAPKRTTMLHVVAVGASSDGSKVLRGQYSIWKAIVAFHRVGPDGTYEKVAGRACRPLEKAAHAMASFAPITAEGLAAAVEQGVRAGREQASFAAALTRGFPVVTTVLGVACVVLFALQWYWGDGDDEGAVLRMGGNNGPLVQSGEWWRLMAAAFLHWGPIHLLVNMSALASFGPMLESLLGRSRYLALYGLSALGAGVASAAFSNSLSAGASGAIWGLMAAGVGLALRPRGLLPASVIAQARQRAILPLVLNIGITFSLPNIDVFGHFGGGVVGLLLMVTGILTVGLHPAWTEKGPSAPPRAPVAWIGIAAIVGLALAGSVGAALANGKPWELRGILVYTRVVVGESGISAEIPDRIADEVKVKKTDELTVHSYGTSPVVINVLTKPLDAVPSDEERAQGLASLVGELNVPPDGGTIESAARFETYGPHRAVHVVYRRKDDVLTLISTVVGDRMVTITESALPDRKERWRGVAARVATSLERVR